MDTEECIKSFGDTTTFHGVAQIIRSDSKLVKIQWVSVVIMVSMITIYQISTVRLLSSHLNWTYWLNLCF